MHYAFMCFYITCTHVSEHTSIHNQSICSWRDSVSQLLATTFTGEPCVTYTTKQEGALLPLILIITGRTSQ